MRLYLEVARRTYRRIATYRSATLAGVFTNTVFGFLLAYVLLAVYQERADVGGFDAIDAVTFTFVAQGLLMALGMFSDTEIADRITTGDVIVDLQRPYDHQAWWAGVSYGKAAYYVRLPGHAAVRGRGDRLRPPPARLRPTRLAFVVSVVLAVGVAFGWRYLLQLSAFWLLDVRGANQLGWLTAQFLSGLLHPARLLPRLARRPSLALLPVRVHAPGAGGGLAGQARRRSSSSPCCALQAAWAAAARAGRDGGAGAGRAAGGGAGWLRPSRALGVWRHLVGARIRADWQYRTSFFLFLASQTAVAVHGPRRGGRRSSTRSTRLAGWSGMEVALLFGLSGVSFGLADLLDQPGRGGVAPHQGRHLRPVPAPPGARPWSTCRPRSSRCGGSDGRCSPSWSWPWRWLPRPIALEPGGGARSCR